MSISNVPELTQRVCVPRAVFIQYPFGRLLALTKRQRSTVVRAPTGALERATHRALAWLMTVDSIALPRRLPGTSLYAVAQL